MLFYRLIAMPRCMLLQVQLHARVNEGSITVDAARLVKELEESYARKVRTVGRCHCAD